MRPFSLGPGLSFVCKTGPCGLKKGFKSGKTLMNRAPVKVCPGWPAGDEVLLSVWSAGCHRGGRQQIRSLQPTHKQNRQTRDFSPSHNSLSKWRMSVFLKIPP